MFGSTAAPPGDPLLLHFLFQSNALFNQVKILIFIACTIHAQRVGRVI